MVGCDVNGGGNLVLGHRQLHLQQPSAARQGAQRRDQVAHTHQLGLGSSWRLLAGTGADLGLSLSSVYTEDLVSCGLHKDTNSM